MKKALIFDMDGTIVDNITCHRDAWIMFLKKYEINIPAGDFAAQNHGTADEMIIRFFGNKLSLPEIKRLGLEKEQIYRDLYLPKICEVTGLTRLLKLAKNRNLKIALATMGNEDNINFILEKLDIKSYFDVTVGGHQVTHGKPHPEIYYTTISKLKVKTFECIAFEDSFGGVQAASDAGIEVIGVGTSHSKNEFQKWGISKYIKTFDGFCF